MMMVMRYVCFVTFHRAFSAKRIISKFRSNSWRATWNIFNSVCLPQHFSDHDETWCSGSVWVLSFICTTFQLQLNIFYQKNYLKFSLQFLAGNMQLLGRSYYYLGSQCGDLRHHISHEYRHWICKYLYSPRIISNFRSNSRRPHGTWNFQGGAICSWDSILRLAGCTFVENTARSGGALFLKGSLVQAANSVFTKNTADTADTDGTAVQNKGNDYNQITFEKCTFVQDAGKGCAFNLLATDSLAVAAKYTSVALHDCTYTSGSPAACLTGTAELRSKILFDGSSTGFDTTIGTDKSECHLSAGFEWLHTERKEMCRCSAG
jgi:hypothetical protein